MVTILSALLLLFSQVALSATLHLKLSSHQVEMGKYLTATFTYQGSHKPDMINLEQWQDDFYIEQADPDNSINSLGTTSITTARLYPRHTGDLTLDAIAQGGSFVKPRYVSVTPSIRNNIDATPQIRPLKTHYWADEPIMVSVKVPLHHPRNEVIAKEWLVNNLSITPLTSIKSADNVQLQWLIYTPLKGVYQLELPAIVQRGRGRFRFHSPKLNVTIKPLPAYLPSSITTGIINVKSNIVSHQNSTIAHITLQKKGYLPNDIEGLQHFYNQLSKNKLALNIQTQEHTEQGITTRDIQITLPQWLWRKSLNLTLSIFNPQTGRVESITHTLPMVSTLPKAAHYALIAISLLVLFIVLAIIHNLMQQWRIKHALRQRIHEAKSADELRLIVLNNGQFKTLNEWTKTQNSQQAYHASQQLNQACYQAQNNASLSQLKALFTV